MAVRIKKILCTFLDKADERQVEETTEELSEWPEGFYRSPWIEDRGCRYTPAPFSILVNLEGE